MATINFPDSAEKESRRLQNKQRQARLDHEVGLAHAAHHDDTPALHNEQARTLSRAFFELV